MMTHDENPRFFSEEDVKKTFQFPDWPSGTEVVCYCHSTDSRDVIEQIVQRGGWKIVKYAHIDELPIAQLYKPGQVIFAKREAVEWKYKPTPIELSTWRGQMLGGLRPSDWDKFKTKGNTIMSKFQKGDILVVLQSSDRNNVGKVGAVIDITDDDYYTLDVMPNYAFKENCVAKAHGADLIREERRRQIEVEGYDTIHDRHHTPQVLCRAAVSYALHEDPSKLVADAAANLWPWTKDFWKPKNQLRNLVRAGALIAAAIDRLQYEQE